MQATPRLPLYCQGLQPDVVLGRDGLEKAVQKNCFVFYQMALALSTVGISSMNEVILSHGMISPDSLVSAYAYSSGLPHICHRSFG